MLGYCIIFFWHHKLFLWEYWLLLQVSVIQDQTRADIWKKSGKKGFVILTKSFVKIGIAKTFCYNKKCLVLSTKHLVAAAKFLVAAIKILSVVPKFVAVTKPFFQWKMPLSKPSMHLYNLRKDVRSGLPEFEVILPQPERGLRILSLNKCLQVALLPHHLPLIYRPDNLILSRGFIRFFSLRTRWWSR